MLSSRTDAILKTIVEEYITRAVPVPSEVIANDCGFKVSSATIRNEMASLEREGYISRPHTSAGGVPSDKGYRYYVESLGGIGLSMGEQRLISHLFHQVEGELEEWLQLAVVVLARLAQNVAVVSMPKPVGCRFKHLELVSIHESKVLAILVLYGARVKQQLLSLDRIVSQPALTVMANKMNAAYSGLAGQRISEKSIELSETEQLFKDCVLKMMQADDEEGYDDLHVGGLFFVFNQPEFASSRRVMALMELIEQRRLLKAILPEELGSRIVRVIIGGENQTEAIRDCSVVISQYGLPKEAVGTVGVIGPTRMPYARTIPVVDYMSSVLSKLVAELY